ncbi:MAG: 50S ribosomal protein L15 [Chloroflexia bacterium]
MKQHELWPPRGATKARKRVGRGHGSGHGKTAGRGMSGQRSRSHHGISPTFEGGQLPLVRRLPYKRGFHNPFRVEYSVVHLGRLAELFPAGSTVTPRLLREMRVVRHRNRPVKVLGEGEAAGPLHVYAHAFSESARQKIEAAGGTCTVLDPQVWDVPVEGAGREVTA